jgi:hypothetical protein
LLRTRNVDSFLIRSPLRKKSRARKGAPEISQSAEEVRKLKPAGHRAPDVNRELESSRLLSHRVKVCGALSPGPENIVVKALYQI